MHLDGMHWHPVTLAPVEARLGPQDRCSDRIAGTADTIGMVLDSTIAPRPSLLRALGHHDVNLQLRQIRRERRQATRIAAATGTRRQDCGLRRNQALEGLAVALRTTRVGEEYDRLRGFLLAPDPCSFLCLNDDRYGNKQKDGR
jgi:hypothetical protein